MRDILFTFLGLGTAYLYLDKFLFRGHLGSLFVEGWRHLLHLPRRRKGSSSEASPSVTLPASDSSDGQLIERKVYTSCQRVPEGDMAAKTASNASAGDNFDTAKASDTEEWTAASFRKKQELKTALAGPPIDWDDHEFAIEEIAADTERIRQEVDAALGSMYDAQLEPSDEEKYGMGTAGAGGFH